MNSEECLRVGEREKYMLVICNFDSTRELCFIGWLESSSVVVGFLPLV